MLVYAALTALLTAGLYLTLAGALRYLSVAQADQDVGQQGLLALKAVRKELLETSPATVRVSSDPSGLLFLSPRGADGRFQWDGYGRLLWRKWVCFYLDGETLVRKEKSLPEPSPYPNSTGQTVAVMAADDTLDERVVAQHLSLFELVPGTTLEIRLAAEVAARNGNYRLEFRSKVAPRS